MNNEEKNSPIENDGAENIVKKENTTPAQKKLSGGMLAAIIGGIAIVLVAVILLIVLIPGGNGGNGNQGGNNAGTEQGDGKTTYTVTVVDQNGDPVKDVQLLFTAAAGGMQLRITDEQGKATYSVEGGASVQVTGIPVGYEYDKLSETQNFDNNGNLNITVKKVEKAEGKKYIIVVLDQNDNPVVGAKVQMCEAENEGVCLIPVTTNANGEGIYNVEEKAYKAAITSLPEGYEQINEDYVYFENGVATIKVNKVAE